MPGLGVEPPPAGRTRAVTPRRTTCAGSFHVSPPAASVDASRQTATIARAMRRKGSARPCDARGPTPPGRLPGSPAEGDDQHGIEPAHTHPQRSCRGSNSGQLARDLRNGVVTLLSNSPNHRCVEQRRDDAAGEPDLAPSFISRCGACRNCSYSDAHGCETERAVAATARRLPPALRLRRVRQPTVPPPD